jgi:RimJ/RimL family protein N-acetyltransferase
VTAADDVPLPDWHGARAPEPEPLTGATVALEPLDPVRHAPGLFAAATAGDPRLWEFLPYGPFRDEAALRVWLDEVAPSRDPLFFAIVDPATRTPAGMAAYLRIAPAHGSIEIGHIWFGAALQRTRAATEAISLLARHAFDDLGHRRLEWKCDARNARSRRAAERFGFTYEGTFRRHMVVKGRNRDTAWFSIVDTEWPAIRAAFDAWPADDNFDASGAQRRTLEQLRAG